MAGELLPFALAMLAIVLPLLLGWLLVGRSGRGKAHGAASMQTPERVDAAAPARRPEA